MASKKSIQYINPTDLSLSVYDGKNFQNNSKREKLYTVSRVFYKDIILYSFKIPKSQADEDLSITVEMRMYEEAGLDVNKTYQITHLVKDLEFDDMYLVEVFAIDTDILKETFEKPIKKVKYIDYLALPFFAFETFYKNKILTTKNDVFVYIGDDEGFFCFYKDGKYISTKSTYSLEEILEKLNDKGIEIDFDKLSEILLKKGLDSKLYDSIDGDIFLELESIFSDILTKINNVALHNRNIFAFEKIDRLFFSTKYGRVKGFKEFVSGFGFNDVEIFDFNLFKQKQENNFLDTIVCSFGFDRYTDNSNAQNITIFQRPPSFMTTRTGKLVLWLVIFISILAAIYTYAYIDIKNLQEQRDILESKFQKIEKRARLYRKEIKKENNEIKEVKKGLSREDIVFKNIDFGVSELENLKGRDNRYIKFLKSVNLLLGKYRLKASKIEQSGRTKMVVDVVSGYKNRDDISKFLKALIKEGFLNVTTKEIKLDDNRYISEIEIEHE